ncbi:MAG TPA: hypothetical protein VJ063_04680 [Verrucomicrobiae bacterium]|nr:hypothetical protein [Verrucomicrobiae bacterium]
MKAKRTWQEKLCGAKDLPKIGRIEGKMTTRWGTGTMVIPNPLEVDELMKRVPKGKLVTITELRAALAKKHKVNIACPITTGIFAWIAAHAAEETHGKNPYWRTLKAGGQLNEKYPGGIAALSRKLQAEGHKIVQKGKKHLVANYEHSLAAL